MRYSFRVYKINSFVLSSLLGTVLTSDKQENHFIQWIHGLDNCNRIHALWKKPRHVYSYLSFDVITCLYCMSLQCQNIFPKRYLVQHLRHILLGSYAIQVDCLFSCLRDKCINKNLMSVNELYFICLSLIRRNFQVQLYQKSINKIFILLMVDPC